MTDGHCRELKAANWPWELWRGGDDDPPISLSSRKTERHRGRLGEGGRGSAEAAFTEDYSAGSLISLSTILCLLLLLLLLHTDEPGSL